MSQIMEDENEMLGSIVKSGSGYMPRSSTVDHTGKLQMIDGTSPKTERDFEFSYKEGAE